MICNINYFNIFFVVVGKEEKRFHLGSQSEIKIKDDKKMLYLRVKNEE